MHLIVVFGNDSFFPFSNTAAAGCLPHRQQFGGVLVDDEVQNSRFLKDTRLTFYWSIPVPTSSYFNLENV